MRNTLHIATRRDDEETRIFYGKTRAEASYSL